MRKHDFNQRFQPRNMLKKNITQLRKLINCRCLQLVAFSQLPLVSCLQLILFSKQPLASCANRKDIFICVTKLFRAVTNKKKTFFNNIQSKKQQSIFLLRQQIILYSFTNVFFYPFKRYLLYNSVSFWFYAMLFFCNRKPYFFAFSNEERQAKVKRLFTIA